MLARRNDGKSKSQQQSFAVGHEFAKFDDLSPSVASAKENGHHLWASSIDHHVRGQCAADVSKLSPTALNFIPASSIGLSSGHVSPNSASIRQHSAAAPHRQSDRGQASAHKHLAECRPSAAALLTNSCATSIVYGRPSGSTTTGPRSHMHGQSAFIRSGQIKVTFRQSLQAAEVTQPPARNGRRTKSGAKKLFPVFKENAEISSPAALSTQVSCQHDRPQVRLLLWSLGLRSLATPYMHSHSPSRDSEASKDDEDELKGRVRCAESQTDARNWREREVALAAPRHSPSSGWAR